MKSKFTNRALLPSEILANYIAGLYDTIPPDSVTNLTNISYSPDFINWTWIDPSDPDFVNVSIWIDELS